MWLLILSCLVLLWAFKIWKSYQEPVWKNLPGPPHRIPFLGNYVDILTSDLCEPHLHWAKKYGPIFRYYFFGRVRVMITDPADVKHVLLNNIVFDKNLYNYTLIQDSFGSGLVTQMDEAVHKYHRNIISPAFALKHLKALVPIFHKKGELLVEDWMKAAKTGKPVDVKEDIARLTSDVIGEAAFGYQLNSQRNASPSSVYNIFSSVLGGKINMFAYMPIVKLFTSDYHARKKAEKALDKEVKLIIDHRTEKKAEKGNKKENLEEESKEMRDLLDLMMDAQSDDGAVLTRQELVDQTKTFLLAGYETSSVCILWTMHLLSWHPEIQQKLADEVISVIGKDKLPTAEDIDKMPYLYKVIRESLRICPPIPLVFRNAAQDVTLGGYSIPKGTPILINIYHQHHTSPVWTKHEVFEPERWSTDDSETNLLGSYIPFILGARNCIGSRFATLEIRVLLAMIIQKMSFVPAPGQVRNVGRGGRIAMVPKIPVRVVFSERK